MSASTNWKSRIKLDITNIDEALGINEPALPIFPFNSFSANFTRPVTVMDSVDDSNIGYVFGNRRYTFAIEVFPVRKNASTAPESNTNPLVLLNLLFLNSATFDLSVTAYERDFGSDDQNERSDSTWAYKKFVFKDCILSTGGIGTYDTTAGLKVIRFEGLSLKVKPLDASQTTYS